MRLLLTRDWPVAVAVHAREAVGEDAAAEESPKLTLDEAGNGAFAGLRAGEECLEFRLDHTVENALLGATSRVAVLLAISAGAMPMGNRKSVEVRLAASSVKRRQSPIRTPPNPEPAEMESRRGCLPSPS